MDHANIDDYAQGTLEEVVLSEKLKEISDGGVFASQINLKEIRIPNNVTSIGDYAFYYCKGLTNITIPNSVTSIGNYTFNYCSGLTNIIIPSSVTSIGERAFCYCSSLTSVYFEHTTAPTFGTYCFYNQYAVVETTFYFRNVSVANSFRAIIPNWNYYYYYISPDYYWE